mmetsp:Transcript_26451/g.25593  ORF Transcript_26451/g.25593 Transcript_26451/m.25593 type:complete len:208 (+) Transcript_26451:253-876(+)
MGWHDYKTNAEKFVGREEYNIFINKHRDFMNDVHRVKDVLLSGYKQEMLTTLDGKLNRNEAIALLDRKGDASKLEELEMKIEEITERLAMANDTFLHENEISSKENLDQDLRNYGNAQIRSSQSLKNAYQMMKDLGARLDELEEKGIYNDEKFNLMSRKINEMDSKVEDQSAKMLESFRKNEEVLRSVGDIVKQHSELQNVRENFSD